MVLELPDVNGAVECADLVLGVAAWVDHVCSEKFEVGAAFCVGWLRNASYGGKLGAQFSGDYFGKMGGR